MTKAEKLVWSGKDFKYPKYYLKSLPTFEEAIDEAIPKEEFETIEEYEKIKEREKSDILNSWLGEQNIEMKYHGDFFYVSVNGYLRFKFPVSNIYANQFKKQVKNFNFIFEQKNQKLVLILVETKIKVKVLGGLLNFNKHFSTKLHINITRAKEREEEIALKTIRVKFAGHQLLGDQSLRLMCQDFDLPPELMNWDDACEYCKNLRLLGFYDWRLPSLNELKEAGKEKNRFRCLNTEACSCWSSDSKTYIPESRAFSFKHNYIHWHVPHEELMGVMCVRHSRRSLEHGIV
jgi:hypothetical protein